MVSKEVTAARQVTENEVVEANETVAPMQQQTSAWVIKGVGLVLAAVLGAVLSSILPRVPSVDVEAPTAVVQPK